MECVVQGKIHPEAALDLTIRPKSSNMVEPQDICHPIQNMRQLQSETENAMSKKEMDDLEKAHEKFRKLTQYLMLNALIPSDISDRLRFELEDKEVPEFGGISSAIYVLVAFFADDFEEVLEAKEEELMELNMECAEFLLSRCLMLCYEPTHSNFLLVAAFFSHLVFIYFKNWECFRILYMAEFCFDVLYRRRFWKAFKSEEDCQNFQLFCDQFNEQITLNQSFNELRDTNFGIHIINNVKNYFHITCNSFYLIQSEMELFKNVYSLENTVKSAESPNSQEIENALQFFSEGIDDCTFLCVTCGSKCYNYLEYRKYFNFHSY